MNASLSGQHFPMRFNALVIETTTRCNAKCGMCYQSSGPKGHDLHGIQELKLEVLKKVVSDAIKVPNLVKRLHVAGGEAFLNEKLVYELLAHGRDTGFTQITMTTNAFWGSSDKRAEKICAQLSNAGMTEIEISWDYWHLAYIDPMRIVRVLRACKKYNIGTILRILTTQAHSIGEALRLLGDDWTLADRVLTGAVFATGRAVDELDPEEIFPDSVSESATCHAFLNLTVNANGNVYPCCAGIDQTTSPELGNVYREPINEVAARMTNNLWVRQLVFGGILSVEKIVEEDGYQHKKPESGSMCTRCWYLFSDRKAAEIVKAKGLETGKDMLKRARAALVDA